MKVSSKKARNIYDQSNRNEMITLLYKILCVILILGKVLILYNFIQFSIVFKNAINFIGQESQIK